MSKRKAAFLDRDGVINYDRAYVHRWDQFEFLPGAIEAMRKLKKAGYALVVVTNQSGIARGYYTEEQYQELTECIKQALTESGTPLDAVYHCPHHPQGVVLKLSFDCDCRKPAPGMILLAERDMDLFLPNSLMIGDKPSDIEAARAAGVGRAFWVSSNNSESVLVACQADGYFGSLLECVNDVLQNNILLDNE